MLRPGPGLPGLSGFGLRKKQTLPELVESLGSLTGKSLKSKINMNLSLVSTARFTEDELRRVPTDMGDSALLINIQKAWCWINCSMHLSSEEMTAFISLINNFKRSHESITSMLANEATEDNTLRDAFAQFVKQRIELDNLKITLQAKYPISEAKEVEPVAREGKEAGAPLWAEPLANIYHSHGGQNGVNTTSFIEYLQDVHKQGELTPEEELSVNSTLRLFGQTKELAAPALQNYLKKTKTVMPNSFKRIFKGGKRRNRTQRRRKTRKNKKF